MTRLQSFQARVYGTDSASTADTKLSARSNTSAAVMRCDRWPPGPDPERRRAGSV